MAMKYLAAAIAVALVLPGLATAQDGFPETGPLPGSRPGPMGPAGALFDRFDTDGDGQITVKEVETVRAELFLQVDANGDGEITRDEALAFGSDRLGDRVDQRIERLDTDGSGTVSAAEHALGRSGVLFDRLDANGDGAITRDEIPDRGYGPRGG